MLDLPSEYRALHAVGKFAGTTVLHYVVPLREMFDYHDVRTVLDYGCGQALPYLDRHKRYLGGKMHDEFPKVQWTLYDPYVEKYSILTDIPSECRDLHVVGMPHDAVICVDVLEHIPESELDGVLKQIFDRAVLCAFFTFCNRPARKTFSDGSNIHVTQRPREWWETIIAFSNENDIPVMIMETP